MENKKIKEDINLHCQVSGCNMIMLKKLKKEMFRAHRHFRRGEKFVSEHSAVPEFTRYTGRYPLTKCHGACKTLRGACQRAVIPS